MDVTGRHHLGDKNLGEEQVAIHRLGNDLRHLALLELDEGVVLGSARLLVAGEAQARDGAELREKATHLLLVEAVGDVAHIQNARALGGGLCAWPLCSLLLQRALE